MILISVLLVLALERTWRKSPAWHIETHMSAYLAWADSQTWIAKQSIQLKWMLQIALPVVGTLLVAHWLFSGFLSFVLQSMLLFLCLGSEPLRQTYRAFLQAAERGDTQACHLYTEQLGYGSFLAEGDDSNQSSKSVGQHLIWLNYQHYAAVIVGYALFGAAGAVLYVMSREAYRRCCENQDEQRDMLGTWLHILDFVPVRITACGLLLVGHFSRAMPIWLRYLTNTQVAAEVVLTNVASKAEEIDVSSTQERHAVTEPKALVALAKRNVMLLLAVIAVLTMMGLVH